LAVAQTFPQLPFYFFAKKALIIKAKKTIITIIIPIKIQNDGSAHCIN
jgi:hypothetical protein